MSAAVPGGTAERPWAGRRVVVLGLGLFGGGAGAARLALARGAHVLVTDLRGEDVLGDAARELRRDAAARGAEERLRVVLGHHDEDDLRRADLVVVNPAVPPRARALALAREAGAQLTTATALLLDTVTCPVAAITGTNGKTSTVTFLGQALGAAGLRAHLGGNVGGSLLDRVHGFGPGDAVVLELSSYQLEHHPRDARRAVDVAAITNVGRDHLDWHGSEEGYRTAKLRIVELVREGGAALVPAGELAARARAARPDLAVLEHGEGADLAVVGTRVVLRGTALGDLGELRVPGAFQRANAAVALGVAHLLGTPALACSDAVARFTGPPHRLEDLGRHRLGGAAFDLVDNGVSTTPESTEAGLEALAGRSPGARRFLLAGGAPKAGLPFEPLARAAAAGGWTLVPFGAAADALAAAARAAGVPVLPVDPSLSHHAAVQQALARTLGGAAGDAPPLVLLSPACASFDGYPNFRARAEAFRAALTGIGTERGDGED